MLAVRLDCSDGCGCGGEGGLCEGLVLVVAGCAEERKFSRLQFTGLLPSYILWGINKGVLIIFWPTASLFPGAG